MRLSGLSLFILLSVVMHAVGAWIFLDDRGEMMQEERGAGATALEIGSLFESVAQTEVEATRVETVTARPSASEPVTARPVTPAAAVPVSSEVKDVQPTTVTPVPDTLLQALTANEALEQPDIVKAKEVAPTEPEKAIDFQKPSESKPRSVETVDPRQALAEAKAVKALPQRKASPPAKQIQAAKVSQKNQAAQAASVASRKGGRVANSKGTAGATGGNGGRNTAANGNAETSNYMGKVRSRVARKKRYPSAARRRGETGTAVIRFVVAKSGAMSGLQLVRSSGSKTLDEAALKMAQKAAPFPAIPASTGKSSIRFTLPISFAR